VALTVVALVLHTAGLVYRMVLEGRPPVTNLYSSAIFIGWGTSDPRAPPGALLPRWHRNRGGGLTGFATLVVAHNLALSGDTMIMLRAVLDTNFWLATHVVVVTLGYSATFVAGFLAVLYVIRGFFTSSLTPEGAQSRTHGLRRHLLRHACSASSAPSSAASGPTSRGAGSGAGTRRRTAP
jgi:hypothetical protein